MKKMIDKQINLFGEEHTIEKLPEHMKGDKTKSGGYTTTNPRKWTEQEVEFMNKLKEQGYSNKDIASSLERSETSVSIKLKRLNKTKGSYNKNHIKEKYETNQKFLDKIKPKSLLDVYSGDGYYRGKVENLVTNDIDKEKNADFCLDAFKLMCKMYLDDEKFDVIDLDPFGSAYDCFDIAIKQAKKGIVITFGEMGHKRWKRLDYVSRHYGIRSLEDFTLDNIINHVQMIGLRNKKELVVVYRKEWQNIARVWFEIKDYKITSQWD